MKAWRTLSIFIFFVMIVCGSMPFQVSASTRMSKDRIGSWQMKWESGHASNTLSSVMNNPKGWVTVDSENPLPNMPENVSAVWIKMKLPDLSRDQPGLLIQTLYGHRIQAFLDGRQIYDYKHTFLYDINKLLLRLDQTDSNHTLYMKIESLTERIGIQKEVQLGNYYNLMYRYMKHDLGDLILGCSLALIAVIMMVCSIFLRKLRLSGWTPLCFIILSIGILFIGYSPLTYILYGHMGKAVEGSFDTALYLLLPTLSYFFESICGEGYYYVLRRFRQFQVVYSCFSFACLIAHNLTSYKYHEVYYFLTLTVIGYIMIVQMALLVVMSVVTAIKGNKEAAILSSGIGMFAAAGVADLISFYALNEQYELFLWKWGVICFIASLIVILGRRFAKNHEQIIRYSKELELYNIELQRSEKMEIISELAASVAHEVRNPLQVTRGFLQLVAGKSNEKEKRYMKLAIEELDRASNIITDFLTFAKPQLEDVVVLNVYNELKNIEVMLVPLANMKGGIITMEVPQNLFIRGNSAKFKQAFINMIKNSIEALGGEGQIHIWAYEEHNQVVIHIRDNGEGLEPKELAKLGQPYFSTKTKGTGLGLMVTFRIIEVMQGKLGFKSEKGIGTEAIVRFPSADMEEEAK